MVLSLRKTKTLFFSLVFGGAIGLTSGCGQETPEKSNPKQNTDAAGLDLTRAPVSSIEIPVGAPRCVRAAEGNNSQVGWIPVGTVQGGFSLSAYGEVSWAGPNSRANPDGIIGPSDTYQTYSILPSVRHMTLLARINGGSPFSVGSSYTGSGQGNLELRVNDTCQSDNSGVYVVSTTGITRPTTPTPPPASLSCSVRVDPNRLVNGKIPAAGGSIPLVVTSQPAGAQVTSSQTISVSSNNGTSDRQVTLQGSVRNSSNQTASCSGSVMQAAGSATLSVSKIGGGDGRVSSFNNQIFCGQTCSFDFPLSGPNLQPVSVTLTATPFSDSTFAGWLGDCQGTGSTCSVSIDGAKRVTAVFSSKNIAPPPSGPSCSAAPVTISAAAAGVAIARPSLGPVRISTGQLTFSGGLGSPAFCQVPGQSGRVTLEQAAKVFGDDVARLTAGAMTDSQFQIKWGTAGRTLLTNYPNQFAVPRGGEFQAYQNLIQNKARDYFTSLARQEALIAAQQAGSCTIRACSTCPASGISTFAPKVAGRVTQPLARAAAAKSAGIVLSAVGVVLTAPFSAFADVMCSPSQLGDAEIRYNGNYDADLTCGQAICSPSR